jgi:glycosyltransferase involved in cell wall biosynthesis
MSKVSVIVPVFNVMAYLPAALDSLCRQTHEDGEFLLVDDGSTDGSREFLHEYAKKDRRFRVLEMGKNCGYGAACNRGLDAATGEHVHVFEPDDVLHERFYEFMTAALGADEDSSFVRCNHIVMDARGNELKRSRSLAQTGRSSYDVRNDIRFAHARVCIWSLLVRRSMLLEKNVRFHESPGASFQDISYYFQVLRGAKRFILLEEWLYFYRQHDGQSIRSRTKGLTIFGEHEFAMSHCVAHLPDSEQPWSKGMLDAMMIEKFIRHGVRCQKERMEEFYEVLMAKIRSMKPDQTENFLKGQSLSRSLFKTLRKEMDLGYNAFCAKRRKNHLMLWGRLFRSENLLYRCLVGQEGE